MADRKALLLRLSQALYEEIQRLAAEDLRSVNGEIEYLLREAVARRRRRTLEEEKPGRQVD
ncbi:MAG: hypothetical protein N2109_02370 [Fimbriimonadales bacterium]|nr:hypothetical protein [Fimbriimonadales bacterium]